MDESKQSVPFATVVVGTFGGRNWAELAQRRAIPSVPDGVPVIHEHRSTLAEARNAGLQQVETEFVIHLDADDELDAGYIEAMKRGTADMRVPIVQHVYLGRQMGPRVMPKVGLHDHECVAECLRYGNWAVIGTAVRTSIAKQIEWEEFGWSEDWAFFARCWRAGATMEPMPDAIYIAHMNRRGRNNLPRKQRLHWHRIIEAAVWPDEASVL